MKRNVNELQFGNNTNNLNFKISKQQKKNNGNLTSRSKAKTSYLNLAYTGNNTTRTFQNTTNFPYNYSQNNCNKTIGNNNSTENYEYILDKLLRYLETKMSENEYNETKKFLKKEISQLVINGISNDNINKNDSISSLIASLSNNKDNEENYFNKDRDNIILTNENIKNYQNRKYTIINVEKYSSSLRKEKERKNNEKKLKLSYDFSNILSSPKNKIIKKNKSTSKSKNKIKNKNINIKTKDIHSLYSIIKNKHKVNETYNKKSKGNQTQSNSKSKSKSKTESKSKSKSKSKSTSRECSNHHNNNSTFCKNFNFSNRVKFHPNKSDNFGKTYSHNSQPNSNNCLQSTFIPNFTIKQLLCQNYLSKNNKNSNYYDNQSSLTNRKITNIKPTIINKTQPLLNEKLFSKIGKSKNKSNNKNNNSNLKNNQKQMRINNENKNKKLIQKKKDYNEQIKSFNFSKIKNNSHTNSKSKSSRIRLNRNKQHSFPKPKKPEINKIKNNDLIKSIENKKIPNSKIDLTKEKKKPPVKNEEIMKQIKNTIDDNLKIMLNFSYENFLSKESEHESKDVSREIEINESNGNLSSNN